MKKLLCPILLFFLLVTDFYSQSPIQVGKGSYAAYTPLYKCKTDEHSGDQSRKMEQRTLYITDENKNKPIPSNDWWTDLLVSRYSGNMWVYPQVVNSEDYGIYVAYPREWNAEGTELALKTQLEVRAKGFQPESSLANNWHDWGFDFVMRDGDAEMKATIAHGMPFTWVESSDLKLQLRPANFNNIKYYDSNSNVLSLPYTGTSIVIQLDDDTYGVYAPEETVFETKGDYVEVNFSGDAQYISIAVLPNKSDLSTYSKYAYVIPRKTEVSWSYNETTGKIRSTWTITTENLMNKAGNDVLQGFIPHHYKSSQLDFEFTDYSYACPRGKMKMAAGNSFNIEYDFNGILPYFAAPKYDASVANPFNHDRMVQMISEYADKGSFGGDTYWGGKGLTQMALYMTFAHEMGETELFEKCKSRLKAALVNWYTFTPGEDNYLVEEQIKMKQIEISPKTSLLPVGKTQEFTCVATDQFGAEFNSSSIEYYLKGDGARLIDNLFYADNLGDYEVLAGVGEIRDTATVSVSSLSDMNLAFNKPVISTSYENAGTLPEYVNDGDITTRWGSQHKDGQWIQFDLKDSYKLTSAEIYWETSSAAEYQLLVSKDGDDWVVAADKKNQPAGSRTDIIDLTQYQGRYLKINCIKRSNTYGFSIFEFKVYGSEIILSTENEEYQTDIEIYAKNGEINIITADTINNIGIYDLTGRCLSFINEIVGDKQVVLDRGHGIYIVRYQQNNVYYQTKIGF